MTFDEIKEKGLLLFEYVRGSKLYHTDTPDSDEDIGGVFISPPDFSFEIQKEVSDEKNDKKWWELGRFMELAMTSNPAVIEALFVPDEFVKYEHPLFKEIRKHKNAFLTKAAFKPFGSYAVSQIQKAQGQNKKIHWDMEDKKRKTPLDFCYTFDGRQGSINIQDWLERNGLRQDCCGLVNLLNMKDCYLMYYDFGQHFRLEGTSFEKEQEKNTPFYKFTLKHFEDQYFDRKNKGIDELKEIHERMKDSGDNDFMSELSKVYLKYPEIMYKIGKIYDVGKMNSATKEYAKEKSAKPIGGHCGIIKNDGSSNTVRLCSTDKDETPVCMMSYNSDAYGQHCRKYKEYSEWKEKRNKARYESNLAAEKSGDPDMKYDCKNMYHSFRNVAMCTEIAEGKGLLLDRRGIDRDFLMDVRNRKFGYSKLLEKLKEMTENMEKACNESVIPDEIDGNFVEKLTKETRQKFFEEWKQTNP